MYSTSLQEALRDWSISNMFQFVRCRVWKRNIKCYEGHYEPPYGGKKNGELGDKINDVIVWYTKKSCVTEVRLETVVPAVGYFNGACLCRRVCFSLLGIEYEDQLHLWQGRSLLMETRLWETEGNWAHFGTGKTFNFRESNLRFSSYLKTLDLWERCLKVDLMLLGFVKWN